MGGSRHNFKKKEQDDEEPAAWPEMHMLVEALSKSMQAKANSWKRQNLFDFIVKYKGLGV
jgi:hypothetical protein